MALGSAHRTGFAVTMLAMCLAACSSDDTSNSNDSIGTDTFTGIAPEETIILGGTEPFWGVTIDGDELIFSTPDNIDGERTEVARFAGNNGLGFFGELGEGEIEIAVTPGECSDGMSDRTYPYTATITLGDATLFGCGHTDRQPFTEEEIQ